MEKDYKLYVLDNLAAITSDELEAAIASLPDWRREKALRFKHEQGRKECTYAYLLLCQALREIYGIDEQPSFIIGEHGKPELSFTSPLTSLPSSLSPHTSPLSPHTLPLSPHTSLLSPHTPNHNCQLSTVNCQLHFTLSHCRQAIACVISERPVGVDVESIGRYSESLARHVLSPEEFALVSSAPDPQIPFTRFWTQKEAIVKLTGRGIDDDLPNLLFKYNNVYLHTEEHLDKGYILSVATYKNF